MLIHARGQTYICEHPVFIKPCIHNDSTYIYLGCGTFADHFKQWNALWRSLTLSWTGFFTSNHGRGEGGIFCYLVDHIDPLS